VAEELAHHHSGAAHACINLRLPTLGGLYA
jgi:hypothetical protein